MHPLDQAFLDRDEKTNERLAREMKEGPVKTLWSGRVRPEIKESIMDILSPAFAAIDIETKDDESGFIAAMCKGLIQGYHERWKESFADIELEQVEATYQADLVNLETMRPSRTFRIAGLLDKLAQQHGKVLFDHKTTSMDIQDPDATYWRQLVIEGQPNHYELLLMQNGIRVDRIIWDVVHKPQIRPKKLAQKDRRAIVSLRKYCDRNVSEATRKEMESSERENSELFQLRVARETIDKPDKYFARRLVPSTRNELAEYAQELWDVTQDIRKSRNLTEDSGRLPYRNSGACMNYNTPCKFLGLCSGHDRPDSDRWTLKEQVHSELTLEGDGRDIITNSRIRSFQTCRRKHYYEYELGIERADAEEKEALFFGNVWHSALDAYWLSMQRRCHGDSQSVNAVDSARLVS